MDRVNPPDVRSRLLVVDDDNDVRDSLRRALGTPDTR
jgi:hypothetical protein